LYGSTCFARQFANQPLRSEKPHLTGSNGRVLSIEERALLAENAERLIAHFEADRITELKQQREEAATAKSLRGEISVSATTPAFTSSRSAQRRRVKSSPEDRAAVEPDALRILNAKFPGLDFYSPGFNGLLQLEIDSILRKKAV
jgi:hypothetical protein